MRNAIATVEIFVRRGGERTRRLTLVIASPERAGAEGDGWSCRLALADLHRPQCVEGPDSVAALAGALARAREWLAALEASGHSLARDRAGEIPFLLE